MVERSRRRWILLSLAVAFLAAAAVAFGRPLLSSPHERLRDAALREGALLIYSATDEAQYSELLRAFRATYPSIQVEYQSLPASEVYSRFRNETDRGQSNADLLINSAMDLQIKLVNDRYAQPYSSPERDRLPAWAVWKNEAYAVTAEPIVIGYNKRLLQAVEVPQTHDELALWLHSEPDKLRGRVGLYDPSESPTGYLYMSQDARIDRDSWDLISALGRAQPRLFTSTSDMIDRVSSGELLLAYNIIGSYALERATQDPDFGVIIPQDYVLVGSRVALIPRQAPHPASARLFLDFMLSQQGQALLAKKHMLSLRGDVAREEELLTGSNVRAIPVGPALMADLDRVNRAKFISRWSNSIDPRGSATATGAVAPGESLQ